VIRNFFRDRGRDREWQGIFLRDRVVIVIERKVRDRDRGREPYFCRDRDRDRDQKFQTRSTLAVSVPILENETPK
jgi:hypothetical protein